MTAYDIKYEYEARHNGHFFDRKTMNFSGDTMKNYGVRAKRVEIETWRGFKHTCFVLYRRHAVKHGLQKDAFFNVKNFQQVLSK